MAKKDLLCAECGGLMWRSATSAPEGVAKCLPCRRVHGSPGAYKRGCRCGDCVAAHSARMGAFMSSHRVKYGESYSATWRRAFKARNGFWPQGSGTEFVDAATRSELYERDRWTCQICWGPIDPDATDHAARASLDHIVPQSRGGTHDPANLRMAHVGCNARRGNRSEVMPGGWQEAASSGDDCAEG